MEFDEDDEKSGERLRNTPKWLKQRFKTAGMTQQTVKKLVADVKAAHDEGLVPTKYIQPNGKKSSMLERALQVTADYQKVDSSTAKKLGYLIQLENELGVKIVEIRAEDGRTSSKKSDPKFNTKNYEGKKYLSAKQKEAIGNLYSMLSVEIKDLDIPKAKEAAETVKKFHEDHNIYSPWFHKDELPGESGKAIVHKPFRKYIERAEEIQKFKKGEESKYVRPNQKLKERIRGLRHRAGFGPSTEPILNDNKTVFTKKLADEVDNEYQHIATRVIVEGVQKYHDSRMNYFDIVVDRTRFDNDSEDHKIRAAFGKKRNTKSLLKWTPEKRQFGKMVVEPHSRYGTWYGRGRTRDYLEKLCVKADEQRMVYLKIVGARR